MFYEEIIIGLEKSSVTFTFMGLKKISQIVNELQYDRCVIQYGV